MSDVKRITKNTIYMYVRFISIIICVLLSTRFLLNALGVIDFGIYTVVSGFVVLIGFIQGALIMASQRYYAIAFSKNDKNFLNKVFSILLLIHIFLAILLFFITKIGGSYALNHLLNIPDGYENIVQDVLNYSIFSFLFTFLSTPFISLFLADEEIKIYSIVSIVDVLFKLFIAYSLKYINDDVLISYALFVSIESFIILLIYYFIYYQKYRYISICSIDFRLFIEVFSFIIWNFFGSFASVMSIQGGNIIINVYFSPVVNSARTISLQINNALNNLVQSFQTAINPHIIKLYSLNKLDEMHLAITNGARYNFYIILAFSVPVFFYSNTILTLWLNSVPKYSNEFLRLFILISLVNSLSSTLMPAAQATGKIKKYQIIVSTILLLEIPFAIILFDHFNIPYYICYLALFLSVISLYARLSIIPKMISMNISYFIKKVIFKCSFMCFLLFFVGWLVFEENDSLYVSCFKFIMIFVVDIIILFICGLNYREKKYILHKLSFLKVAKIDV